MLNVALIVGVAIMFYLTGCDFPDALVLGLLFVIYYHVKMLRTEK